MNIKITMRIGIDIRSLMEKHYSGVAHYTHELVRAILEIDHQNEYVLFYNTKRNARIPEFCYANSAIRAWSYSNKYFNLGLRFFSWPKIDRMLGGVDIFFMPNINFIALKNSKLLLTIHDLSFEYMPKTLSWKSRLWHTAVRPQKLCLRADKIIAVSQYTKNDLVQKYSLAKEKVSVVYHGVDKKFQRVLDMEALQKVREKYSLPQKFILYLGNIEPRKNIGALIESYKLSKIFPEYHLVLAGSRYKKNYLEKEMHEMKDFIHCTGFVEENDKPALYSLASLFCYISLYEGFGLPPLEAMACGTPVVASNTSSLPEVLGHSAVLCDPYDIHDISLALKKLVSDNNLRSYFIELGLQRSREFTWEKAARDSLALIKNLL